MAAEELIAKQDELRAAIMDMQAKEVDYQSAREPYLQKKAAYTAAIALVDEIDNALEALQQAYEPPAPPQPE